MQIKETEKALEELKKVEGKQSLQNRRKSSYKS